MKSEKFEQAYESVEESKYYLLNMLQELEDSYDEQIEATGRALETANQFLDMLKGVKKEELPELLDDEEITMYAKWEPRRLKHIKENPWLTKYENKPRFTKPSNDQLRIKSCFEKYFNAEFSSKYCDWNRNHLTGLMLELDGYNEELGIAFEYNGSFFHYTSDQQFKDECKEYNCKDNGVKLYVIHQEEIDPSRISSDEELYLKVEEFINNNKGEGYGNY